MIPAARAPFLVHLSALALLAATLAPATRAQTWTGAVSSDFLNAGNWNPGGVPGSSSDPTLDAVATVNLSGGNTTVGIFRIGSADGTAAFNLSNGANFTTSLVLIGQDGSSYDGRATASGSGTVWETGDLFVGDYGTASLTVSNGATINASAVEIGWNGSASGNVTVDGGTLNVSGTYYNGYLGNGTTTVQNGGKIQAALIKVGQGSDGKTALLTANGGYGASSSLGTSNVEVSYRAKLAGNDYFAGSVYIQAGGTLAPSAGGTMRFDGGLELQSGAALEFILGSGAPATFLTLGAGEMLSVGPGSAIEINLLNGGGALAGSYTLLDWSAGTASGVSLSRFALGTTFSGYDFALQIVGSTLQLTAVTAVPEPATCTALAGLAALGLVAWRRRHRARTAA